MPRLSGVSHVDLTVSDGSRSVAWYQEVLGFKAVAESHEATYDVRSMIHPSGMSVNLATHHETVAESFDERRIGLDHLSFQVADREGLEQWVAHLDEHGVDHSGIIDAPFGATVVFRDPDNIQLELFVHPTAEELARALGTG